MPQARFSLPPLPFDRTALEPAISSATFAEHHGGHHRSYVERLNQLAGEEDMADADLLAIIRTTADAAPDEISGQISAGDLFVHAAQHFNHCFFWKSLAADGGAPDGPLADMIARDFGSLDRLLEILVEEGSDHFASGWLWLVAESDELALLSAHDAQTPVIDPDMKPLLVIDLWEHAYYLDHRKDRKAYLEALVGRHLDWSFAARALAADDVHALDLGIDNAGARRARAA